MSTGLGPPALSAKALLPLTQWSTAAPAQLCHSDLKSPLRLDCLTSEPQGSFHLSPQHGAHRHTVPCPAFT